MSSARPAICPFALALVCGLAVGCAATPRTRPDIPAVGGPVGQRPTIAIPSAPAPKKSRMKVLVQGNGPAVTRGQVVITDVAMWDWENKKPYMDTYQPQQPTTLALNGERVSQTWETALQGRTAGSRVLLVTPATYGFGPHGMAPAGITPTHHMAVVFDVLGGYAPAQQVPAPSHETAKRPAQDPATAAVAVRTGEQPRITGWGTPPSRATVRTLIAGTGPKLADGDKAVVHHRLDLESQAPLRFLLPDGRAERLRRRPEDDTAGLAPGLKGQRVGSRIC
ncbi:FKBP-type peptidyl-prolyl cis-trans isomerase [Streptomyces sp. NPDC093589]|uniref:FKBP-type peptidyl-prolyl cis-trans isomerase n=1 Tax=Streptomyces sp. NPDC093589 TaxID=3366043 RepID=UPI0037F9748F